MRFVRGRNWGIVQVGVTYFHEINGYREVNVSFFKWYIGVQW